MKFTKVNIKLSVHGRERIQQRFNKNVGITMPVAGYVTRVYEADNGKGPVASIATMIGKQRAVMIVSTITRELITVMSEGPVVDAVFNKIAKKAA
jgi:hypothetical protein